MRFLHVCAENSVSLSLGDAVAITAAMEGLILVTVCGLLLIIVYTCAKRKNKVNSKRSGELITQPYNVVKLKQFFSPNLVNSLECSANPAYGT